MMGRTHTLTGLAAGAVTLPLLPTGSTAPEQAAWVFVVGGMALLPDLDHPQATVARMWGPLTQTAARAVETVARGHRQGTHDLLVAAPVFGLIFAVSLLWLPAALVTTALAVGLALRALAIALPGENTIEHPLINAAASAAGAWWLVTTYGVPGWLPYAVSLGVLTHIAGDAITEGGIPVPLSWLTARPRRLPSGPLDTGSVAERYVIAPALVVLTGWLVATHTPLLTNAADTASDLLAGLPIH